MQESHAPRPHVLAVVDQHVGVNTTACGTDVVVAAGTTVYPAAADTGNAGDVVAGSTLSKVDRFQTVRFAAHCTAHNCRHPNLRCDAPLLVRCVASMLHE